ncbi:MAG: helix-turn-helix transcriptional regulator [Oceanicaulis sp.]|jgi:transcriptional regulator with XRE-family HTH domain|nr:helix-turn-helix transcriptional regulator [Oceanicaulis sp.]
MTKTGPSFGERLQTLRKKRSWSQGDLAKKVDTSAPIIGRYERGEMTPSIEVAAKLATVLGVSTDYLLGTHNMPDLLADKSMLERWTALDELSESEQRRILDTFDALLRDALARRAYAAG